MKSQHFYEMWEADGDGAFPVKQFAGLPEFCKPILKEENAAFLTYIDGWEVKPSGDTQADLETGRTYAEMTVALRTQNRLAGLHHLRSRLDTIQNCCRRGQVHQRYRIRLFPAAGSDRILWGFELMTSTVVRLKPNLHTEERQILCPFDKRECITLKRAADIAGKSESTIRGWCEQHGLGRRVNIRS